MADNTLSLHLSDDTKKRLDQLSQTTNRSPTSITSEALEAYLNQQEWQIEAIDDAIRLAEDGEFVSHEAMSAWLASWGTTEETAPPEPSKRQAAQ